MENNHKAELLVPAGTLERLETAILYGADAVYAGTPDFSLRTKTSFTIEELKQGREFVRKHGKKLYLTLNLFTHNKDVERLPKFIETIRDIKPDGVIIADPGVFLYVRENAPELSLHVSTQANVCSHLTVNYWKSQGADLCVLGRETSFAELKEIREKCPDIKLESFIHGAMCMTYSGRCLLSNFMSERGANQGNCSHSCRWNYKVKAMVDDNGHTQYVKLNDEDKKQLSQQEENQLPLDTHMIDSDPNTNTSTSTSNIQDARIFLEEENRQGEFYEIMEDEHGSYILNSKDICLMPVLDEILESKIDSLKIEGRNKSEYYVAVTTRAYRHAIDSYYQDPTKWRASAWLGELFTLQNRGYTLGFHNGTLEDVAHNYDRSSSISGWQFAGVLREWDGDDMIMEVRNALRSEDVLEFLTPKSIEPIRLRIYEFFPALGGISRDKVSAGQNFSIRIAGSQFNNYDIDTLKTMLPKHTVVRKDILLKDHSQYRLEADMRSLDVESGKLTREDYQAFKQDPNSIKARTTIKEEAHKGRPPRLGKNGCCGRGCNGCNIFAVDPKYAKAREKMQSVIGEHRRLSVNEKHTLVEE